MIFGVQIDFFRRANVQDTISFPLIGEYGAISDGIIMYLNLAKVLPHSDFRIAITGTMGEFSHVSAGKFSFDTCNERTLTEFIEDACNQLAVSSNVFFHLVDDTTDDYEDDDQEDEDDQEEVAIESAE